MKRLRLRAWLPSEATVKQAALWSTILMVWALIWFPGPVNGGVALVKRVIVQHLETIGLTSGGVPVATTASDLAAVLAEDNDTGGTDLDVTDGDALNFLSSGDVADAGIERSAAGILKITDGATGNGAVIGLAAPGFVTYGFPSSSAGIELNISEANLKIRTPGGGLGINIRDDALGILLPFDYTELSSDPVAPVANTGRLYTRDNGSGKTQLVVRFPTGAIQVIATEP